MIEKLPKKKFWELYNKLPVALQEALFNDDLWESVGELCSRYEASENLDLVSDGLTDVLAGILPPNEYIASLKQNLKADPSTVNRMIHEINRFILYPVKAELEEVYSLQMTPLAGNPSPKASPKSAYHEPIEP